MITFRRMTLVERLLLRVPSRRRAYEKKMLAGMRHLMGRPDLPVNIDGQIVPHGFGARPDADYLTVMHRFGGIYPRGPLG